MINELLNRRSLLMGGKKELTYITDGLVLHLDGIDKGTTDTTKWVDLINNVEFADINGNSCHGNDCIHCAGNIVLKSTASLSFPATTHAVEVAISGMNTSWEGIILLYTRNDIQLYHKGSRNIQTPTAKIEGIATAATKLISVANTNYMLDGVSGTAQAAGEARNTAANLIGGVSTGTSYRFAGDIFSIRIYNRLLTFDEMLHNQKVDNVRFQLGLNI